MHESAIEVADVIRLIDELEAEVNNGGFDQYFFNSTGDNATRTVQALETIGASKTASLLREACLKFPGGTPPTDISLRRKLMLETVSPKSDEFNYLDEQFYRYDDNIGELLHEFKRASKI